MGEPNASRADVARFFGRMAFGASQTDLDTWTGKPYDQMVDTLVVPADPNLRAAQVDEVQRTNLATNAQYNLTECQGWWLNRMRMTPYRVEERMTLFWHDHFATGYGPDPHMRTMMIQNQTLRVHALGNFRTLLNAVTIDPAMLQWLNGTQNYVRDLGGGNYEQHINENYGREFFELFTLGVQPQVYTETDVREAARAFTGWLAISNPAGGTANASRFFLGLHDRGTKTILGTTIGGPGTDEPTEYQRVADIALAREETAYFLAYKLVQNFGYDPVIAGGNIKAAGDPLIEAVAQAFRTSGWDITTAVRTMAKHDAWRNATTKRVRMPVETLVQLIRAFSIGGNENTYPQPWVMAERMGQALFRPPNVAGWPNGKAWLSQSKMLARYDLAQVLFNKWQLKGLSPTPADLTGWCNLLGLDAASLSATTRTAVETYLVERAGSTDAVKKAGVLSLLVGSPDWQVM